MKKLNIENSHICKYDRVVDEKKLEAFKKANEKMLIKGFGYSPDDTHYSKWLENITLLASNYVIKTKPTDEWAKSISELRDTVKKENGDLLVREVRGRVNSHISPCYLISKNKSDFSVPLKDLKKGSNLLEIATNLLSLESKVS